MGNSIINMAQSLKFYIPERYDMTLDDATYDRFMAAQDVIDEINWITSTLYQNAPKGKQGFVITQGGLLKILTYKRYFSLQNIDFEVIEFEHGMWELLFKWEVNGDTGPLKILNESKT